MPKLPTDLTPFWSTTDGRHVRLYHGNVTDVLARLPEKSVHCCVTSPPYWGLRDYGTGTWEGGDAKCDHKGGAMPSRRTGLRDLTKPSTGNDTLRDTNMPWRDGQCGKCGAKRMDQQIGAEPSPDCGTHGQAQCGRCFVCSMVAVFRGVRRVLRDDGTCWLNLGDSYSAGGRQGAAPAQTVAKGNRRDHAVHRVNGGLAGGNLVGIPWRVALALQSDGWILRQDIVWAKPAPMPESVRNRCTKAHEYVFLLAKSMKYFYDAEAIKEVALGGVQDRQRENGRPIAPMFGQPEHDLGAAGWTTGRSNKRSVWTVSSNGYEGAHFAVFPPKLIEPIIRAGTSEKGCCAECAAPWRRVLDRSGAQKIDGPSENERDRSFRSSRNGVDSTLDGEVGTYKTVGWEPGCTCKAGVVPCTVLDPFIGSGTTCEVSIELGRASVGIDLNEKYLKNNTTPRIEGALLRRSDTAKLVERKRASFKPGRAKLGILKR